MIIKKNKKTRGKTHKKRDVEVLAKRQEHRDNYLQKNEITDKFEEDEGNLKSERIGLIETCSVSRSLEKNKGDKSASCCQFQTPTRDYLISCALMGKTSASIPHQLNLVHFFLFLIFLSFFLFCCCCLLLLFLPPVNTV